MINCHSGDVLMSGLEQSLAEVGPDCRHLLIRLCRKVSPGRRVWVKQGLVKQGAYREQENSCLGWCDYIEHFERFLMMLPSNMWRILGRNIF